MDYNLKIDKKTKTFKLDKLLPDGCTCVIVCVVKVEGLIPLKIELANDIKVEYIDELLKDETVSQVTLIPVNFNSFIHLLKDWRRF